MNLAKAINMDERADLGLQDLGNIIDGEVTNEEEPKKEEIKTKSDLAAEFFDETK